MSKHNEVYGEYFAPRSLARLALLAFWPAVLLAALPLWWLN